MEREVLTKAIEKSSGGDRPVFGGEFSKLKMRAPGMAERGDYAKREKTDDHLLEFIGRSTFGGGREPHRNRRWLRQRFRSSSV